MPPNRARDLVIVCCAIALVIALSSLRSSHGAVSQPSTYDTGANGYAALYELLGREGVRVSRFERPLGELQPSRSALVLAGENALAAAAPGKSALTALDAWVRGGGTLIAIGSAGEDARKALGLPLAAAFSKRLSATAGCGMGKAARGLRAGGTFEDGFPPACTRARATLLQSSGRAVALAYRRGKGTVIAVTAPSIFGNLELSQHDNAAIAYALFSGAQTVAFDERVYGHQMGRSFWQVMPWPMRAAVLLACATLLAAIAGANLPFAPPKSIDPPMERDSSAYVASLARMLQRGGAAADIIARLDRYAQPVLSQRARGDERARYLLHEFERLRSHLHPGAGELLAAGRLFAAMQKEYE